MSRSNPITSNTSTNGGLGGIQSIGNIKDVLDQVKSGKLDKSVAFTELRDILQQAVVKRSKDVDDVDKVLHPSQQGYDDDENVTIDDKSDNSSITRFTKEERQLIINKLIEKKRLDRSNPTTDGNRADNVDLYAPPTSQRDNRNTNSDRYNSYDDQDNDSYNRDSESINDDYHDQQVWNPRPDDSDPVSRYDYNRRPNHRYNNTNSSFDPGSALAYDDTRGNLSGSMGIGRSNRILRTEAAIREEMFRECTFHPQIKPLPSTYGQPKNVGTPFYDRVTKWQKEKDHQVHRKRQDFAKVEVQDCSFHPTINRHSYKAMQELRGNRSNSATRSRNDALDNENDYDESVTERLYREAKTSAISRNKFLEDEMRMQDEINKQLCTFKPNLQAKGTYDYIGPKYNTIANTPDKSKSTIITREMRECTFTPKIKGVKPHMASAKLYLSEKVVDRLSKPISLNTPNNSKKRLGSMDDSMLSNRNYSDMYNRGTGRVMDVASFMGGYEPNGLSQSIDRGRSLSRSGSGAGLNRSHSAPRERGRSLSRSRRENQDTTNKDSTMNSAERNNQFESFLLRQKYALDQKSRKLSEVTNSMPCPVPAPALLFDDITRRLWNDVTTFIALCLID